MNDRASQGRGRQDADAKFAAAVDLHQKGAFTRPKQPAATSWRGIRQPHAPTLRYLGLFSSTGSRGNRRRPDPGLSGAAGAQSGGALSSWRCPRPARTIRECCHHNQRAVELQPGYVEAISISATASRRWATWLRRKQPTDVPSDSRRICPKRISILPISSPSAVAPMRRLRRSNARLRYVPTIHRRSIILPEAARARSRGARAATLSPGTCHISDFIEAIVGFALAYSMQGDAFSAMTPLCRALVLRPTLQAKELFVSCARWLNRCPNVPQLRELVAAALREPWGARDISLALPQLS